MSHNELPDVRPVAGQYSAMPAQKPSRQRGCFLFTVPGCIGMSCLSLVAVCCVVTLGPIVGFGTVAALLATNTASETGAESLRLEPNEGANLRVDNTNIDLTLRPSTGTARDISVEYELTANGFTSGSAQEALDNLTVVLQRTPDGMIELAVQEGDFWLTIYDLDATVTVPRTMDVIDIRQASDVQAEGVDGNYQIAAFSGDVILQDVRGSFDVVTTSFGDIQFNGDFLPNTDNRFETSSGDIRVSLPSTASVNYDAQTSGVGEANCPNVRQRDSCFGKLGDGTAQLTVRSDSGDITIATGP
ncbi:MAG: DUF4097 family beta strand repeat-containing protein [Anaerolineales bacterium]